MATNSYAPEIQGVSDDGQTVTEMPVYIGGRDAAGIKRALVLDASGNLQVVMGGASGATVTFADVNATATPGPITETRVAADLLIATAADNAMNRPRSAKDLSAGPVGGGALLGAGIGVYDGANWRAAMGDVGGRQVVVGGAAIAAAQVGNPVPIAAGTTAAGGNVAGLMVETAANPNLRVSLWNGVAEAVIGGVGDNALIGTNLLITVAEQMDFNGTGADRHRNNNDVTLLASAARTTTQTSADITTFNCKGITVILDMTNVAAAPSVTVTIDGKDPASGKYYNLLTGAAVVAVTTNVYRIQESIPAVANKDVPCWLPRIIRIVVTANNANSGTYSVGYTLHSN